jgi:hypothetical protein
MQDATNGSRRHQINKGVYRGATVRKYIDAVEKGMLPPKFTILDAMMILTGAWNRVIAETVRNCFKKAGIGSEAQQSAVCDTDDPFSFLSEELESLKESSPELVSTLYDVIGTDQNVLTSNMESLTDEEILAEFRETDDGIDDDSDNEIEMLDDTPKRPATSEVRQSIDTLLTYSIFVDEGEEEIRQVTAQLSLLTEQIIQKNKKQRNIQSFFAEQCIVLVYFIVYIKHDSFFFSEYNKHANCKTQ